MRDAVKSVDTPAIRRASQSESATVDPGSPLTSSTVSPGWSLVSVPARVSDAGLPAITCGPTSLGRRVFHSARASIRSTVSNVCGFSS